MNNDFLFNQGQLLNNNGVIDQGAQQGICFALATDWCLSMRKNRNFRRDNGAFHQMISRQRAYTYTWSQRVHNLGRHPTFQGFFQAAEPPSYRFMQDLARHEAVQCGRQTDPGSRFALAARIRQLTAAGRSCLLGLWGTDGTDNWGHAVAFGCRNAVNAKLRYFDSNFGQYSWAAGTGMIQISNDIANKVFNDYVAGNSLISRLTFYTLT